ncbi:hypothetical protein [Spirosoma aerophilum]
MISRFFSQVTAFGLFYMLAMMGIFPFLIYFGKPKPWQKAAQFLMSFPVDNEKIGAYSFFGVTAVFFLNGLLWGLLVIGLFSVFSVLRNLFTG